MKKVILAIQLPLRRTGKNVLRMLVMARIINGLIRVNNVFLICIFVKVIYKDYRL